MQQLTSAANTAISELAQRYGVSVDAVTTLLNAVAAGGGSMAQFYHPELGGGGQWMRGGMTMVGDMFNAGLQSRVSGLCSELSTLLGSTQVYAPSTTPHGTTSTSNGWWPGELGTPSASGGQNNARYAYFPDTRRLAIDNGGKLAIYDTLDHAIGGVQQQQGGPWGSLSFTSQFGTFTVESLPRVDNDPAPTTSASPASVYDAPSATSAHREPTQSFANEQPRPSVPLSQPSSSNAAPGLQSSREVLEAIERLGQLFSQGFLTNDEFQSKKAELLSRL